MGRRRHAALVSPGGAGDLSWTIDHLPGGRQHVPRTASAATRPGGCAGGRRTGSARTAPPGLTDSAHSAAAARHALYLERRDDELGVATAPRPLRHRPLRAGRRCRGYGGSTTSRCARGTVYATVLIDAETGRGVNTVEGRTAGVAEKWLRDHPGTEVVCRDGSGPTARRSAGPRPGRCRSATAGTGGTCWPRPCGRKSRRTAPAGPRACPCKTANAPRPPRTLGAGP